MIILQKMKKKNDHLLNETIKKDHLLQILKKV